MRKISKSFISMIPHKFIERALGLSLLRKEFNAIRQVRSFSKREELWENLLEKYSNERVTLLEFGVFEGYSISKFAEMNTNVDSKFVGFDSFEGLPEDWLGNVKKGAFDVEGKLPLVNDERISFVKGWFQNTLPQFISQIDSNSKLVVHYDADIYSATLFVMMQLDALKVPYEAIFDEFTGHETRALYNYCQLTGATVEFYGKKIVFGYPSQVSCRITPQVTYSP